MKPRNREINIFSLSMLDVISGALGAFLIIMIVLFPYYKKETIDYRREIRHLAQQLHTAREDISETRDQLESAIQDANQAHYQLETVQQQLDKTFLLIHISWENKYQDVDLHVVDPSGVEFYYAQQTDERRPGTLSVDTIIGPGNEVWEVNEAPPGDYKVYALLYSKGFRVDGRLIVNHEWPVVKGRVSHTGKTEPLPEITLGKIRQKKFLATITVSHDGTVTVNH